MWTNILLFVVVVLFIIGLVYYLYLSKVDKYNSGKINNEQDLVIDLNQVVAWPTHEPLVKISKNKIAVGIFEARRKSANGKYVGRTIIWSLAYEARLTQFEIQRFQIMADTLNCRIIVVEMPGVGISMKSKMPFWQKIDLIMFGSFNGPARSMLEAIMEFVEFQPNERVEFGGYSQGVKISVAMIDILSHKNNNLALKFRITRFIMIEPVSDQQRTVRDFFGIFSLLNILRDIGLEEPFTDRYLDQNKPYPWLVPSIDRTKKGKAWLDARKTGQLGTGYIRIISPIVAAIKGQFTTELISGIGLRTPFIDDLLKAIKIDKEYHTSGIDAASIDIIRFNKSRMSIINDNRQTALELQAAKSYGIVTLTTLSASDGQGLHHPAFHSGIVMMQVAKLLMK